ncbi:MAG: 6-carboxytetrahydropterin synthase QueD [Deltaproteobacteria bacterium CG_4_8_14_3_um_filter_51_11]|nr:6-carboxytetrahydropterin synthase QueD [bacterium]OIP39701.1 MAG: 6-carboxytetrahydropterin synthase QueD [Desulfobacteraceae bacterium CG2_30_51_40]PIP45869.1 MAG: 6-carboxytetrahydropterin synthase QueD [Deltaproteobacteria bacterium CG23_combo_of_CG06-09_8_20_14_all_51_20]PIW01331.1 MAG: 6-carboxytetrahydropterin synthase QueD [Deltaproteobacteria bacterium CG17_big_fil_post_rev_8_21_14_2_50_51_6]PIX18965.1 MAG: 6-carboxytetrahydropterin synthase QueD [Deltaproteobacteria bacterium CG_4_
MYELKIVSQFAAAHQLREHKGGCENLHGHNWKVEVIVAGSELSNGLLMDFKDIKAATKRVLGELDHKFLNDLAAFKVCNTSSELIARHIFERLSEEINSEKVKIARVTAWESDSACATFFLP